MTHKRELGAMTDRYTASPYRGAGSTCPLPHPPPRTTTTQSKCRHRHRRLLRRHRRLLLTTSPPSHSVSPYPAPPLVAPTPLSPARRHLDEMQELHAAPSGYVSHSSYLPSMPCASSQSVMEPTCRPSRATTRSTTLTSPVRRIRRRRSFDLLLAPRLDRCLGSRRF